jgi:hypothetical protein
VSAHRCGEIAASGLGRETIAARTRDGDPRRRVGSAVKLFYGWIIVGAGIVVTCIGLGAMFSLSVFLQPMAEDVMEWTRLFPDHLAHAARADLCRRLGRTAEDRASYERALVLTKQEPEARFLERRLAELSDQTA